MRRNSIITHQSPQRLKFQMQEKVNETAFLLSSTTVIPEIAATSASFGISSASNDTEATSIYSNRPAHCYYEQPPLTDERFWLVTVFGTAVSIISIVENLFLFYLFLSRLTFPYHLPITMHIIDLSEVVQAKASSSYRNRLTRP